jgi:hypothetical protein
MCRPALRRPPDRSVETDPIVPCDRSSEEVHGGIVPSRKGEGTRAPDGTRSPSIPRAGTFGRGRPLRHDAPRAGARTMDMCVMRPCPGRHPGQPIPSMPACFESPFEHTPVWRPRFRQSADGRNDQHANSRMPAFRPRAHPMSPQDDVNRSAKLATGFERLQQNFTLDSGIAVANPAALQNSPGGVRFLRGKCKSARPGGDARFGSIRQAGWISRSPSRATTGARSSGKRCSCAPHPW